MFKYPDWYITLKIFKDILILHLLGHHKKVKLEYHFQFNKQKKDLNYQLKLDFQVFYFQQLINFWHKIHQ